MTADKSEHFVRQLTENQNRIFGYVYSLLGDRNRAADVVQETNLVLWRKIDQFDPERPFLPWAFAVARFQVLAHLRDAKRGPALLDAELVESLSGEIEKKACQIDELRDALQPCLQQLTPNNMNLVKRRYFLGMPIAEIGAAMNRGVSAIKVALLRIRRQLADCVQQRVTRES